jgi:hypothetical protein
MANDALEVNCQGKSEKQIWKHSVRANKKRQLYIVNFRYIFINSATNPDIRGCIQKSSDWIHNEIYAYNNKHSLRCNTKGYGGKTH